MNVAMVHHDTLALARDWMAQPEGWCDDCCEIIRAAL